MSSVLMVLLALAAPPAADSENHPAAPVATESRAPLVGRELDRAVHDTLRRWAKPEDPKADLAAREFLDLYRDLVADTRLAASTRDQLRNKVRGRLMQLSEQITRRIARETRASKGKSPGTLETPDDKGEALAQLGRPPLGGGFGPGAGGAGMGGPGLGGFGGGFGGGPGGNAPVDNGQALVDLIQKTIAPSTWDVNGGNGSIYYWPSMKVLVVRQTDEVHGQIGDTLGQLERANR